MVSEFITPWSDFLYGNVKHKMSILSVLKDGNTNTSAIIFQAKIRTDIQENLNSMMLWTKLVSCQTALIEACIVCKIDENLLVLSAEQLRLQSSNCSIHFDHRTARHTSTHHRWEQQKL